MSWVSKEEDAQRLHEDLFRGQEELQAEVEALTERVAALEQQMSQLLERMAAPPPQAPEPEVVHWVTPEDSTEPEPEETVQAPAEEEVQAVGRQILARLEDLLNEAPDSLLRPLQSARDEVGQLLEERPPEELAALRGRLATVLVPELVELCEAARRLEDPDLPFFSSLEPRLSLLSRAAGLEEIQPAPGSPYLPEEQNALKVVRSSDPAQRDRVDRCVSRGFRYDGKLIKKAEVIVFL
ncbi:MAG: hypothetical protein AB1758_28215 [Candidatus Eremiobacterota bacterium]